MDLHNIREEYRKRVLSQHDCHENPIKQFELWLNEAITGQVNEPTAVNVATVDENGRPSGRIVLLKEVNEQGFVFFTNYHGRKGRAIECNPFVALTFFWPELERQVRIEGKAVKIPAAGFTPDAIAKAIANGKATIPTMTPAIKSEKNDFAL